ncbi:hypothetical protein FD17_GL000161 [Lentilactobacillus sunkii DSM 19904]|uniref:Uncharacterized protein n=1 Tax=Lentilactobacillus sunkii DSM 19904 TaxID=1423808 RepID=A0A0R1L896_9LACO|nr:hypothetical protein FD17_GL000161 [Lentilactobacillus sunkii DSM 19904]
MQVMTISFGMQLRALIFFAGHPALPDFLNEKTSQSIMTQMMPLKPGTGHASDVGH